MQTDGVIPHLTAHHDTVGEEGPENTLGKLANEFDGDFKFSEASVKLFGFFWHGGGVELSAHRGGGWCHVSNWALRNNSLKSQDFPHVVFGGELDG